MVQAGRCGTWRPLTPTRTSAWCSGMPRKGPGWRARQALKTYFLFLEIRHKVAIHQMTGRVADCPVDEMNRPRGAGRAALRIPPSAVQVGVLGGAHLQHDGGIRRRPPAQHRARLSHRPGSRPPGRSSGGSPPCDGSPGTGNRSSAPGSAPAGSLSRHPGAPCRSTRRPVSSQRTIPTVQHVRADRVIGKHRPRDNPATHRSRTPAATRPGGTRLTQVSYDGQARARASLPSLIQEDQRSTRSEPSGSSEKTHHKPAQQQRETRVQGPSKLLCPQRTWGYLLLIHKSSPGPPGHRSTHHRLLKNGDRPTLRHWSRFGTVAPIMMRLACLMSRMYQ